MWVGEAPAPPPDFLCAHFRVSVVVSALSVCAFSRRCSLRVSFRGARPTLGVELGAEVSAEIGDEIVELLLA